MSVGTEQTATTNSQIRETPKVSRTPEEKQSTHSHENPGGIYLRMREIVAASGAQEPPPQDLSQIFRSTEFSQPVNDVQKARALQTLQRSYGNRYLQRVLGPASAGSGSQSRSIQTSPGGNHDGSISSLPQIDSSSGHPLDSSTRGLMEESFGHDFNDVRVHTDSNAHEAARSLSAEAFTTGRDVYFSRGAYDPASVSGRGLLAHELTHVVQQRQGLAATGVSSPSDPLEQQAEAVSRAVIASEMAPTASALTGVPSSQTNSPGPAPTEIAAPLRRTPPRNDALVRAASLRKTPATQGRSRTSPNRLQRMAIQRTGPTPPTPTTVATTGTPTTSAIPPEGVVDTTNHVITIPEITLPEFKVRRHGDKYGGKLVRPANYTRTVENQRTEWKRDVQGAIDTRLENRLATAPYVRGDGNVAVYFLKSKSADLFVFGEKEKLKPEMPFPFWDKNGHPHRFQVDHRLELQLSGTNVPENMELLEASANASSGRKIQGEIERCVKIALTKHLNPSTTAATASGTGTTAAPPAPATTTPAPATTSHPPPAVRVTQEQVRQALVDNRVEFLGASTTEFLTIAGEPEVFWPLSDVKGGKVLDPLDSLTESQIEASGVRGRPTELVIFTSSVGSVPRRIPWAPGSAVQTMNRPNWIPGFNLTEVLFQPGEGTAQGLLRGEAFRNNSVVDLERLSWEIHKIPHVPYGGYVKEASILSSVRDVLKFKGMSPIQISTAYLDDVKGLVAVGQVLPTVPLFRNLGIDLVIEGEEVRLRKLFERGDFQFPGPILVTQSTLEIFVSTRRGLGVTGQVQFEINRVGRGRIGATATTGVGAGTAGGFSVEGEFDFDTSLFRPARVEAWYRNQEFGFRGHLGIPPNRVRGIRSADINVSYSAGRLDATGVAEFSIPGLQRGSLNLSYSEAEGLALGGSLQLANNIPGIRSGSLEAQVRSRPGGEGYQVTARGTAVPAIPGVATTLTIGYDDGAITIEGRAAYNHGMLSGQVEIGATNRPLDAQGRPMLSAQPSDHLRAYGGGTVTIRITPWLQGTIGVRILPNGEIEVSGAIGLPASLNIFPEKRLDKNIFNIGIDIPIVGVAVAGQRIGIFATIRGGLDASAGIGPGQLRELGLTITYNPSHEDQTHVTGRAQLYIPAHAGLRLFVRGGLGVGIPIVSATAALEVGGSIGLEGAVTASVQVDWMPRRGLILDAMGEIYAQPKFKFDVTGMVLVEANLLVTTVELYSKRWNLASFEYGSNLRFGVRFPVHYQEGRPFDISLSDVQFEVPHVDPMDLLTGLIRRI
jgi:hypothetical protein